MRSGFAKTLLRRWVPRRVRNWIRSPGQTLRWLRAEGAYRVGVRPVVEVRPGWVVRCHPAAHRAIVASQVRDPAQAAELAAFIQTCVPGMVLFDLGAHFGVFSLAALHFGGPHARAVAVEPSPTALRLLAIQARLNRVSDRLVRIPGAAAREPGTQEMVAVGVIADGYFVPAERDHPSSDRTRVPGVSIDSLVRDLGYGPTHLKIDVEGEEAAVLRGGVATLSRSGPPQIFLELHNDITRRRGGDPGEAVRLLEDLGYRITGHGKPLDRRALERAAVTRVVAVK